MTDPTRVVFTPPPSWPAPPAGFMPPRGWQPDPSWPAAPAGWRFFADDAGMPVAPPPGAWEPPGMDFFDEENISTSKVSLPSSQSEVPAAHEVPAEPVAESPGAHVESPDVPPAASAEPAGPAEPSAASSTWTDPTAVHEAIDDPLAVEPITADPITMDPETAARLGLEREPAASDSAAPATEVITRPEAPAAAQERVAPAFGGERSESAATTAIPHAPTTPMPQLSPPAYAPPPAAQGPSAGSASPWGPPPASGAYPPPPGGAFPPPGASYPGQPGQFGQPSQPGQPGQPSPGGYAGPPPAPGMPGAYPPPAYPGAPGAPGGPGGHGGYVPPAYTSPAGGQPQKSKTPLIIGVILGALLLFGGGGFLVSRLLGGSTPTPSPTTPTAAPTTKAPTKAPTTNPAPTTSAPTASAPVLDPEMATPPPGPTLTRAQYAALKTGVIAGNVGPFTSPLSSNWAVPTRQRSLSACVALSAARKGYITDSFLAADEKLYSILYDTPVNNGLDRAGEVACDDQERATGASVDLLPMKVINGVQTREWVDDSGNAWVEVKYGNVDVSSMVGPDATTKSAQIAERVAAVVKAIDAAAAG